MGGSGAGRLAVAPVLLQKGSARVALYGLGYIRDVRLYKMLTTPGEVEWKRPAGSADTPADSWFNLFFIHQNRASRGGGKNSIGPELLPEWLDLVVWGHEHRCLVNPTPVATGGGEDDEGAVGMCVSQPGSSVQTSLTPDEAEPKRVLLLEVRADGWKSTPVPLVRVRPFIYDSIALADAPPEAAASQARVRGAWPWRVSWRGRVCLVLFSCSSPFPAPTPFAGRLWAPARNSAC